MLRLITRSSSETKEAGKMLGERLSAGDTVLLYGDLGAGKTVFVKGIAEALGVPEREIASASFTIISEHTTADKDIAFYHIDLYRLETEEDIEEAGVLDCIGGDGICAVEWAERLPELKTKSIKVRINILSGKKREILIEDLEDIK